MALWGLGNIHPAILSEESRGALISEATRDSGRRTAESSLRRSLSGGSLKEACGTRDRVMVNVAFFLGYDSPPNAHLLAVVQQLRREGLKMICPCQCNAVQYSTTIPFFVLVFF
jgi:hypothetical protein